MAPSSACPAEVVTSQFDAIVAFAELEQFIDTPVKRYSSGMYVRLAFAVAAHLEPEILILDEVLAVGDADFQRKCLDRMSEISTTDGRTILLVSHNMQAVRRLCGKCLFLEKGRSMGLMPVEDAIARYSQQATPSPTVVHARRTRPRAPAPGTRVRLLELGTVRGPGHPLRSPHAVPGRFCAARNRCGGSPSDSASAPGKASGCLLWIPTR